MNILDDEVAILADYITDHKKVGVEHVLSRRTRYITAVLEDVYQPQNASAVMRTCECLGLQDLHVVEDQYSYKVNRAVVHGASKWMNLRRWRGTETCFAALREQGYRIIATTPSHDAKPLEEISLEDGPLALCFGSEDPGLSDNALAMADEQVIIPMEGYTKSFNISVSAGIVMYNLTRRLRESDVSWQLSPEEIATLRHKWYKKIVRKADLLLAR